jgi:hypothetical protein
LRVFEMVFPTNPRKLLLGKFEVSVADPTFGAHSFEMIFGSHLSTMQEDSCRDNYNLSIYQIYCIFLWSEGGAQILGIGITEDQESREQQSADVCRLLENGNERTILPPTLIQVPAAPEVLRETVPVQGTVREKEINRRGDVLPRFDSPERIATAVIPFPAAWWRKISRSAV